MIAPPEFFEQLKCSMCDCVLSKFPIYTTKTDNNQLLSICGRCQVPSDDKNYLRNEIYETLAKLTLFPCINRKYGCMDDLLPDDVAVHELQCSYRSTLCMFNQNNADDCKWKGSFIKLIDHYQTEHTNLVLNGNKFEMDPTKDDNIINILQYKDEMFIVRYNFDTISKHFNCSITPIGFDRINKKYYGQINLKSEKCTINYILPEIDVFIVDDDNNDKQQSKSIDINIESMLDENNSDIIVTISLAIDKEQLNNDRIIENSTNVKCSSCSCNLYPPIYQCSGGYYACLSCKNSFSCKCYSHESFTILSPLNLHFINIQCKYDCGRSMSASYITQHNNICINRPSKCLLTGCPWENCYKDIAQHILTTHEDKIIKTDKIVPIAVDLKSNCNTIEKTYMFLKFSGNLFKLVIQYKNPHQLWRLELMDFIEQNNFSFEITIFDNNKIKRVSIKESCARWEPTREYTVNDLSCIWLHKDQFAKLLFNNTLSFKINISK